mgnify:CR=1 FL=1
MPASSILDSISKWAHHKIILQKLNNPFGFVAIILFTGIIGLAIGVMGIKVGALILGALLALPVLLMIIAELQIGLLLMLIIAFLTNLLVKMGDYPVGISLDALTYFMIFAIFIRQIKERDWDFINNPVSFVIVIWLGYNLMQALNPVAGSVKAWLYAVRSMAGLIMVYFIALYSFNNLNRIKWMIKAIIVLTFAAALYGIKQEFIGFEQFELDWLYSVEKRALLIVQWGRIRPFSFFSDPTTCGILMVYMAAFCAVIASGPYKIWKRVLLIVIALCCITTMGYGGSRTPVVLVPIGALFYVLLTLKKNIVIGGALTLVVFMGFMLKTSSNPIIYRMQSAFRPGNDASVQVRMDNQKLIQPYIQSHPFGSGLGSTGLWGQRFTPNSWLAHFAHDSGFVRVAVEMGWIGLIVYMVLLFKIMQTGIYYYLRVRDPVIKNLYLAINISIFMLLVASYPQEIIILLPNSIIFYIFVAAIVRLKDFDPAFQNLKKGKNKDLIQVEEDVEISV